MNQALLSRVSRAFIGRRSVAVSAFVLLLAAALVGFARSSQLHAGGGVLTASTVVATATSVPNFIRLDGTPVASYPAARKLVTFPVVVPAETPAGFTLESIKEFGPPAAMAPTSPYRWILARYSKASSGFLEIIQGYTGAYVPWYGMAPDASKGTTTVDGKEARWVRGLPASGVPAGAAGGAHWRSDASFTSLTWQSAIDGDSPRYIAIASDTLGVHQLIAVAASLR